MPGNGVPAIFAGLQRLDALLAHAVAAAREAYGVAPGADSYRGLVIGEEEVDRLLARPPGLALGSSAQDGAGPPFAEALDLEPFDLDVLVVAVAPEVDTRYERLYAYLHDDVTRKRPSVELALRLLCSSPEERLAARRRFDEDAPLRRYALVRLVAEQGDTEPTLLAQTIRADDAVVRLLLGDTRLDPGLARFLELDERPSGEVADERLIEGLARTPARVVQLTPAGADERGFAGALAARLGRPLLVCDLSAPQANVPAAVREATVRGAVLLVTGADAEHAPAPRELAHARVPVVVGAGAPVRIPDAVRVALRPLPAAARRRAWASALARARVDASPDDLDALATRFRLGTHAIESVARTARRDAALLGRGATVRDAFAAARTQTEHRLDTLSRRISPTYRWDDLVLPPDRLVQLRELCGHVRHRTRVYDDWGFDRKLSLAKGVTALFAGPSGTGKTMAAEIVAAELELDLYRIDLASVVSKWIGETEKNLARIFDEAEAANAILFFDEADALFGRRTEIRDAHDRYANIEVAYLLQRIEEHDGVVILATNVRKNMDEAFVRRIGFTIEFPLPAEAERRRLWAQIWPVEAPRRADLRLDELAEQHELTGAAIRNVALAAAFLAAEDGGTIDQAHLLAALQREYQKVGKIR